MILKRYEASASYYGHGKQKRFFFKRNAIQWLKEESVNDYMTMKLTDRKTKKHSYVRNRYENYTFYMTDGCVKMVRNDKPFVEDNLDL